MKVLNPNSEIEQEPQKSEKLSRQVNSNSSVRRIALEESKHAMRISPEKAHDE